MPPPNGERFVKLEEKVEHLAREMTEEKEANLQFREKVTEKLEVQNGHIMKMLGALGVLQLLIPILEKLIK